MLTRGAFPKAYSHQPPQRVTHLSLKLDKVLKPSNDSFMSICMTTHRATEKGSLGTDLTKTIKGTMERIKETIPIPRTATLQLFLPSRIELSEASLRPKTGHNPNDHLLWDSLTQGGTPVTNTNTNNDIEPLKKAHKYLHKSNSKIVVPNYTPAWATCTNRIARKGHNMTIDEVKASVTICHR